MRWLEVEVEPMTFDRPASDQLDAVGQAVAGVNVLRTSALRHLAHLADDV